MMVMLNRQAALVLLLALLIPALAACGGTAATPTESPAAVAEATTEPTSEATEPTSEATEPTSEATEPTSEATEPTSEATEPTTGTATLEFPAITPRAVTVTLTGSGASFPDPIYQRWIEEYKAVAPNVTINYQSVGSGQGRKDFFGNVTDFGGTDKFASDEELSAAGGEVLHIPTVLGAVVATYNLPGVEKLQFSGETLANIFLGNITKWNDPAIAADNPGATLPETDITVVHRSDGSGTTSIFTNYLSSVSSEWQDSVGAGDTVEWPTGIGGEKNPGVAAAVQQTEGAIGYVELIYALSNNLPAPAIRNAVGEYVEPNLETTTAAAQGFLSDLPEDLRINIVNPPEGADSYPIAGFTWVLVRQEQADETKAQALTDFLYWALTQGDTAVTELRYAPLPPEVKARAIEKLSQVTAGGQPAFELP